MMNSIYQGKMEEKSIKIGKEKVQRYTGINEYCIWKIRNKLMCSDMVRDHWSDSLKKTDLLRLITF